MNTIKIGVNFYTLFSDFSEMTKKEFLNVQIAMLRGRNKTESKVNVLLTLFHHPKSAKKALQTVNLNDKTHILQCADFCFEPKNYANIFPHKLKYLKLGRQKVIAPVGYFADINNWTFYEFVKCYSFYQKFVKTQNIIFLNKLCAVIFRPASKNPISEKGEILDNREVLQDATLTERAEKFKRIPYPIKNMIFLYFLGQFELMADLYPEVFKRADKLNAPQNSTNWIKITFELADNNGLEMQKYFEKTTSFVLVSLSEKIKIAKEQNNK